ncbi:MAG TPA: hypothetical protein VNH53_06250 [Sphingomicrobium sp.]|jgi:hypothetical protein|nr:hypothetical protein [Sphingomicrobium sp.]
MQRAKFLAVLTVFLAGCAIVDTGEIDYRRVEPVRSEQLARATGFSEPGGDCAPQPGNERLAQCNPLLPAPLVRKNQTIGAPIKRNDVYSVSLEHGVIAHMVEPRFAFRRAAMLKNPLRKVGEVLVLATVFEFPANSADTAASRFIELTQLGDAKVVYYSPDVEAKQDLNFSNIPLLPPTRYNGNPVAIQIVVLELDRMSGPMQGLLKQLAQLGVESNILPGGPAASTLVKLGTSMIANDHDDVIFEYRFVLDPSDGTMSADTPRFEAGRYVLRRGDERRADQIWRNLRLDHNTGKLIIQPEGATEGVPFEGGTYFTVNVKKLPAGTEPSNYTYLTNAQMAEQIKAAADQRDRGLTEVSQEVTQRLTVLRKKAWLSKLREEWSAVRMAGLEFGRLSTEAAPDSSCELSYPDVAKRQIAEMELRSAAMQFMAHYDEASGKQDEFTDVEKRDLLRTIWSFFTPFAASVNSEQLSEPANFEAAFAGSNKPSFVSAVVETASANWKLKTCTDLIAAGLAKKVGV